MVEFKRLELNTVAKKLFLDFSVSSLSYYTNVYLKNLYVIDLASVGTLNPIDSLDKAFYSKLIGSDTYIDSYWYEDVANYIYANGDWKNYTNVSSASDVLNILKNRTYAPEKFKSVDNTLVGVGITTSLVKTATLNPDTGKSTYSLGWGTTSIGITEVTIPGLTSACANYVAFNKKNFSITLQDSDLLKDPTNNLYYVVVETIGTPSSDTPCGMDSAYTVGIVYDDCAINRKLLADIKQLSQECSVYGNLTETFFLKEALEAAIKLQDYSKIPKYFNILFLGAENKSNTCTCNGGISV